MKKRVVLLFICLFVGTFMSMAQDVPVGVIVAFKKGSSQELNRYFSEKVDLVIQNRAVDTDRRSIENAMTDFFSGNKVHSFDVNHEGKRDDSSFIVGTLKTTKGNYRVNCFFKRMQNRYFIHQIRIDRVND